MDEIKRQAVAVTTIASFLWGTSFIVNKVGSSFVDAYNFAFLRFLVAGGISVLVAVAAKKMNFQLLRDPRIWMLGVFNAGGFLFQYLGISLTTASIASLLVNTSAILVPILSWVFLRESFPRRKQVAVGLAVIGIVLLTTTGDLSVIWEGTMLGDGFVLLAGATWAFFMVANKQLISKGYDVSAVTTSVMLITALTTLPFAFFLGTTDLTLLAWQGWASVIYTGVFCSLGAFYLWSRGLQNLSATTSALILLLEIVWAILLGFLLLQESFTLVAGVGAGLLLAAIFLSSR